MELFLILLFLMPLLNFMFTFLLSLIVVALAFAGGFYSGVKNAKSSKVEKATEAFKTLKD